MTAPPRSDPWLVTRDRDLTAPVRLLCFPFAGGGASVFRSWRSPARHLFELWPVQLPARENRIREQPFTRLDPLLAALEEALLPHLVQPFAFFGHSLGALIGFELARRMRDRHRAGPVHLFVSGRRAPHLIDTDEPVHGLPDAEFIRQVRKLNGTPESVLANEELMNIALPLLRADFAVSETYVHAPGAALDCPISAFGGSNDVEVPQQDIDAWRLHTGAQFRLRMFPGDHFFLHSHRDALLSMIASDLGVDLAREQGA
ncbi:thioesterase II family protein [Mesorhizobium mediterraneum]|uniref:thioesterase II family protein n=1 Tax=Mesorhizobium mediterraneum TaxID=43617 RepID=UPI001AEF2FB4|nr:thioesterase [Mesorhizobium mediterraneum]